MLFLAGCSVIGVAVILVRLLGLRHDLAVPPNLREEVERLSPDNEAGGNRLNALLMGDRSPLGRILRVAIRHLGVSRSENQDAIQVAARAEVVLEAVEGAALCEYSTAMCGVKCSRRVVAAAQEAAQYYLPPVVRAASMEERRKTAAVRGACGLETAVPVVHRCVG